MGMPLKPSSFFLSLSFFFFCVCVVCPAVCRLSFRYSSKSIVVYSNLRFQELLRMYSVSFPPPPPSFVLALKESSLYCPVSLFFFFVVVVVCLFVLIVLLSSLYLYNRRLKKGKALLFICVLAYRYEKIHMRLCDFCCCCFFFLSGRSSMFIVYYCQTTKKKKQ